MSRPQRTRRSSPSRAEGRGEGRDSGSGHRRDRDPVGSDALVVDCVGLRSPLAGRRRVRCRAVFDDAALRTARVLGGAVAVAATVEAMPGGYAVTGEAEAVWASECRRCLSDLSGPITVPLRELFEYRETTSGDVWPVSDERIDLGPAVRQAVLLALPLAPLCSPECAGPAPDRFPTGPAASVSRSSADRADPPIDPRWAALSELTFDG